MESRKLFSRPKVQDRDAKLLAFQCQLKRSVYKDNKNAYFDRVKATRGRCLGTHWKAGTPILLSFAALMVLA